MNHNEILELAQEFLIWCDGAVSTDAASAFRNHVNNSVARMLNKKQTEIKEITKDDMNKIFLVALGLTLPNEN